MEPFLGCVGMISTEVDGEEKKSENTIQEWYVFKKKKRREKKNDCPIAVWLD